MSFVGFEFALGQFGLQTLNESILVDSKLLLRKILGSNSYTDDLIIAAWVATAVNIYLLLAQQYTVALVAMLLRG